MAARLGIHVLGPGCGESVVLELPDGSVGVIDSFASRSSPHPVLSFLTFRFPSLSRLRFLAVTHPHADHCSRVADLLDRFGADEVWAFHPFPSGQVQTYFTALHRLGRPDRVEAALGLRAGSVAVSLLQLRQRVSEPVRAGRLRFRQLIAGQPLAELCGGRVRIHFLTPEERSRFAYADEVERAAERIFADYPGPPRTPESIPEPDHNLASGAILVEFGKTRALIMADAEDQLWERWLASGPPPDLLRPVHFVKTAHHGSPNGYHNPLYANVGDPAVTVAVVTPFNRGRTPLPTAGGAQAVRSHVRELYCTNRAAAESTTGLSWAAPHPGPLPGLPVRWANAICRDPSLAGLLIPTLASAPPGMPPRLPLDWIMDARRNPDLWRLIRPMHHLATPCAVEEHTVSVYFDNKGNLVEFHAGDGVGRLP